MNGIANSPNVLAAIRERKLVVKEQLQTSRTTMLENVRSMTGTASPQASNRMQSVGRLITKGILIYQGFRFCSNIFSSINSIFSLRKRRR
jgi:hypothetical protein